jgi:cytochrome c oxidase subunit 2
MARTTIAAGTLPNTAGNLSAWVADPQTIKPGNFMPRLDLSGPELVQVRDFLESLK